MKDRQGIERGKCTEQQCECSEYMAPQDSRSARCDYCDHVPVRHVKMIELGTCMKCKECEKYETEEPGSYSNCGYCECPAQHHQGAEKLFKPAPTQPSMKSPTNPSVAGPRVPNTSRLPSTSGAPNGGPPRVPGQCKVTGCTKPCFNDKGHVHEFCGRTHAEYYKKMQAVAHPTPTMINNLIGNTIGTQAGPAKAPVSQDKCENCQVYPPNKGYKLCQHCYTSKK